MIDMEKFLRKCNRFKKNKKNNNSQKILKIKIIFLLEIQNIMNIYIDIVKISPRPYCYDIKMQYMESITIIYTDYCSICFDPLEKNNICTMNCQHSFCINCVKLYLAALYKKYENNNEYYPNCPLCRTYISFINIDDEQSCVYFCETFFKRFIPDYFNKITNNELTLRHKYEKLFYYRSAPDEEVYEEVNEDDDVDSPYNHPILIHYDLYSKIGNIIGHLINTIYARKILQAWLLFIYMANFVLRYKEEILELYYKFSPEI
jgi:hypothetical protein